MTAASVVSGVLEVRWQILWQLRLLWSGWMSGDVWTLCSAQRTPWNTLCSHTLTLTGSFSWGLWLSLSYWRWTSLQSENQEPGFFSGSPGCLFGFLRSKSQPPLHVYQLPEPFLNFLPRLTFFHWWKEFVVLCEEKIRVLKKKKDEPSCYPKIYYRISV